MIRIATISVDLPLSEGVTASIDDLLEVSLDCSDCKRKMRTVVFREGENHGVCTPSGHWFRGVVVWVHPSDWGWEDRPTPKKIIGVVYLREQDMLDVNLELIRAGFASHKKAPSYKLSNHTECHYVRAEGDARIAKRGLWATSR